MEQLGKLDIPVCAECGEEINRPHLIQCFNTTNHYSTVKIEQCILPRRKG